MIKKVLNKFILFFGGFFTGFIFAGKIIIKTKFEPWSLFDTIIIILLTSITFFVSFLFDTKTIKEER